MVEQVKKSGVQREINVHATNVKWMFIMSQESSADHIVVQVESNYGYRLVTLRSPVQVLLFFPLECFTVSEVCNAASVKHSKILTILYSVFK